MSVSSDIPAWFVLFLSAGVLLAGLILLVLGIRGTPRFSEPHCAKCGYDLEAARLPTTNP